VLEVRGLRKTFDGFVALGGVDLRVARGELCAIIGPNGAGKSTFFNCITGHLVPDAGEVRFRGRDIAGRPAHQICRLGVARSFQRVNIFPRLTVFENVQAAVLCHRRRGADVVTPVSRLYREETLGLLDQVGLAAAAETVSGTLSYGYQKQLELGIALAAEPELLLLDEPTAGMSAQETRSSIALIARIARERGLTLLFTEHDMEVVFSIAERITVLHQGRVIAGGTPDAVRGDPEVRRVYLGSGA
jgi:branched-chain amino acid transport system ATP-binding protein